MSNSEPHGERYREWDFRCICTDDAHNIDATLMRQKSSKTYDRYNSMNIDMTQMFTNSNICPEWYTWYVFKQNFEIFNRKLSIKRFKLTSSISHCKLEGQLTAGGLLI